jgi:hypothetical protein
MISGCGESASSSSTTTGKSGSMARFALSGNHLYTISNSQIQTYDISTPTAPIKQSKTAVSWDIQTLFSYENALYIGSQTGMYIYTIKDTGNLEYTNQVSHFRSCDPVVVSNNIAYVTLHTNSVCFNDNELNQLQIYDVEDPKNISQIDTLNMWEPKGLGIDNNNLFVCDGSAGLKVYDINASEDNTTMQKEVTLNLKENISDIDCYDLIAFNNTLYISNQTNLLLYDYNSFPMSKQNEIGE